MCMCAHVHLPDVKCGVEDVGLFQPIELNLAVTHLVVNALQLIIQLQLLPFKLAVLLLVPFSAKRPGERVTAVRCCIIFNNPLSLINTYA